MPGFQRDLAVPDPWRASLERSRARRARAARRRRLGRGANGAPVVLSVRDSREEVRDLALREPWARSLGRSRARRRAAELQFVPAGTRAKRASLGALAALTVGPTASLADGPSGAAHPASSPEPPTTSEHSVALSLESEGRQVQLLQRALGGIKVDGELGPETEAAIQRLQARHGLAADGVVGPATWSVIGVHGEETLSPPPAAEPPAESERAGAGGAQGPGAGGAEGPGGSSAGEGVPG